ncbi:MAG TPA: WecB/TagA/CpsF family glycosyltransferase [Verrucomicrobiae bacterium]|jgi:N-acetylglucosaminyldiphosphoundecaprenol N-acetyl-beta-D-mannosaminyltransferase
MASSLITKPNQTAALAGGRVAQNLPRRTMLMGCPVDLLTSQVLLNELAHAIDTQSGPKIIQFINGNKIAQVRQSPDMGHIMWRTNYALVDGQPLLPMGRMLGVRIPERIDGVGLMAKLLKMADERRYSVFLLGAKQSVLETCVQKIRSDYPNARIAGYRNGYFKKEETDEVVRQIRATRCDILFLGMGSPMKEHFADRYASELGATVIQGVGGTFDVMAGLVKRAPKWIQQAGFEWLFRIAQEPRRMFWRYTTTNATCLSTFGKEYFSRLSGRKLPAPAFVPPQTPSRTEFIKKA